MVVDTSAIVEALIAGPQVNHIFARLKYSATPLSTMPTVVYEATVVLTSKLNITVADAETIVRDFLADFNVAVFPIDDRSASIAIEAFARYGKGRHPAKLNFGDCFSYAGAKSRDMPLLYVGNDFSMTDLAAT